MNKKFKVGLIRVLTTEDEEVLSHMENRLWNISLNWR